ncbi:YkgJ family cysteine cluster protein [Geofilum rubicundum]|uniref:YkgJ family cysteine cluster protein n=1 Tax=Geofilum rubicundum TaxID=472113 RepID=UPI00078135A0|nr:YkgJ family cysteine cluster protein [Geofilum rubicundum]
MKEHIKKVTKHVLENQSAIDSALRMFPSCCRIGCAYCCIQPIEIVNIEELPISEFIRSKMTKENYAKVRLNIANWAEYFNDKYDDTGLMEVVNREFRELIDKDRIACPFLIENKCSIYPVRPLACRAHIMFDSPDFCRMDGLREAPPEIKNLRNFVFTNLTSIRDTTLRYLPVALSSALGLPRIFKPHRIRKLS